MNPRTPVPSLIALTLALAGGMAAAQPSTRGNTLTPPAAAAPAASAEGRSARRWPELAKAGIDFGGRVQIDHGRFDGVMTRDGDPASATYARRAELSARWRISSAWRVGATLAYQEDELQLDLAAVTWQPLDSLRLRAGRIDPDFGLDNANSSSWTVAIERSAIFDITPGIADSGQGLGLRADAEGRGWHASAGLYDKKDHTAAIGRAVWMPLASEGRVWQLGASVARSWGIDEDGRLRTRLGVRGVTEDELGRRSDLSTRVSLPQRYDGDTAWGLEAAWQQGPVLLQLESVHRSLDAVAGAPARSLSGQSLQLAWSPTGHARRHEEALGRFGRPRGDDAPAGRWEVFYRFDTLKGSDSLGATVHTLGASWFFEESWRVSANVVSGSSDDPNTRGERDGLGIVLRAQAVF